MAVNAHHLITLSIGKIAGSRCQRGGVCLRKNLLVASVLTTARAYYYEEMCHNMQEHSSDTEEDCNSCTDSPSTLPTSEWDQAESCEQQGDIVPVACTPCAESQPELASCGATEVEVDKENDEPTLSVELTELKPVVIASCDHEPSTETDDSLQRTVLSDCTSSEQNSEKACKRKRSEVEVACEYISPKKARTDCEKNSVGKSNTMEQVPMQTEGSSITSLVNIFRSGLQGLSGDVNSASASNNHYSLPRTAFTQAPISIAAC